MAYKSWYVQDKTFEGGNKNSPINIQHKKIVLLFNVNNNSHLY